MVFAIVACTMSLFYANYKKFIEKFDKKRTQSIFKELFQIILNHNQVFGNLFKIHDIRLIIINLYILIVHLHEIHNSLDDLMLPN